jgi:hypothetical protein
LWWFQYLWSLGQFGGCGSFDTCGVAVKGVTVVNVLLLAVLLEKWHKGVIVVLLVLLAIATKGVSIVNVLLLVRAAKGFVVTLLLHVIVAKGMIDAFWSFWRLWQKCFAG